MRAWIAIVVALMLATVGGTAWAVETEPGEPAWLRFERVLREHYPAEFKLASEYFARHSQDDRTAKVEALRTMVWPLQRRAIAFADDKESRQMLAMTLEELREAQLVSADACLDAVVGKPWADVTPPALLDRELTLWAELMEKAATTRRALGAALSEADVDRLYEAAFDQLTGADLKVLQDLARADRGAQSAIELEATCRLNIRLLQAVLGEDDRVAGGWVRKMAAEWEAAAAETASAPKPAAR